MWTETSTLLTFSSWIIWSILGHDFPRVWYLTAWTCQLAMLVLPFSFDCSQIGSEYLSQLLHPAWHLLSVEARPAVSLFYWVIPKVLMLWGPLSLSASFVYLSDLFLGPSSASWSFLTHVVIFLWACSCSQLGQERASQNFFWRRNWVASKAPTTLSLNAFWLHRLAVSAQY